MALTFPAAFVFQNAADTATITASGSLPKTPPSLLQNQHVGKAWVVESDTAHLTIALAAATSIDSIGLFGVNLTTAGFTRVRVSLSDTSAVDGALYDSASAAGRVSAYYKGLVALIDGPVSARYIRIDLSESGIARIMAGFLMIGLRNQVTINFSPGNSDQLIDPSIVTPARSGAEWIDERQASREWSFDFGSLSATERFGWVEDLRMLCGIRKNVMMVRDCSSSNLGRDTLCGRLTQSDPIVTREFFIGSDNAYSQAFKIRQRL